MEGVVSLSSSSNLDVKNFNEWYLEKIGAKSNSPANPNVQVKTTKDVHLQDEVPIPVPVVVKSMEENHATQVVPLFTPNAGNLFEGPASLHNIINVEKLRGKKVALGLRFFKVGEMLLS